MAVMKNGDRIAYMEIEGENVGHGARQHDPEEHLALTGAQHPGGTHKLGVNVFCAVVGIDGDEGEAAQEDDEEFALVAQAEPQDGQRNPGQRRDGAP